MACLFAILAVGAPRIALLFVWLFTPWIRIAFNGFLFPLLGLIFLPYTTLFYVIAYNPVTGLNVWSASLICLGMIVDLGAHGGSAYGNRSRRPGY